MSESTTYLNVEQAAAYLQFPTVNAFRHWVRAYRVPRLRRGNRTLLFLRRDLDEALGNRKGGKRATQALASKAEQPLRHQHGSGVSGKSVSDVHAESLRLPQQSNPVHSLESDGLGKEREGGFAG